ncbi:hypothetical protein, partial [Delftia acidovorans]|uniref:hypothetical protein n=1 Tax=Delftia acidovorans TaxID=80866 RepID=UPI002FDDB330
RSEPRNRHDAGCPQRSEGVADIRVAFFDLTFLGESRKGSRLPGRDPASKNTPPAGSQKRA